MAHAPQTDHPEAEQISFELERFALTDERRLELSGRWSGVRGRRFIRPTLTLISAHKRTRLLAELDHKPWTAEDGMDWVAAFALPEPGEDVLELELAVASDIAVALSPPTELTRPPRPVAPSEAAGVPAKRLSAPRTPVAAPAPAPAPTAGALQATIDRQRLEIQSLERRLSQATATTLARESADGDRADALQERDQALAERDRLRSQLGHALDQRDQMRAELDRALDQQATQAAGDRLSAPVPRLMMSGSEHRLRLPESQAAGGWMAWITRSFAVLTLAAVVAAILLIIQSA